MSAKFRWIGIVVGLLVGNAIAVLVLIGAAGGDTERRVVPDYYAKAAAWNDVMAAADESAKLGWHGTVVASGRQVELTLVDGAGAPIEGAVVTGRGTPRAYADEIAYLSLKAVGGGRYVGTWQGKRPGLHQVALTAVRGPDHWVSDRIVELAGAP